LPQIGPSDLKRYATSLSRKGQARSSVRRVLAPVKSMLADAHEDGLIRFNPTAGARILPPVRQDEEAVQRVNALAPDASQFFRIGWNAKQVSRFLGHTDAGFTLRTYVHVLDEDLPEPGVLDSLERVNEWINSGSTRATETGRNRAGGELAAIPLPVRDSPNRPNDAEVPTWVMSRLL
jgi:hypothetical protein